MKRIAYCLAALPLATVALSGCTGDSSANEKESTQLPAGVTEQYQVLAAEVAERGGSTTSGDWTVKYIVEAAEPWFERHGNHGQAFRTAKPAETNHIEIIPTETSTGRIIPDVPVTVEVIDDGGQVVQKQKLNFYYSTFFHYANNFSIPEAGVYTLRAKLGAPSFNRHGEEAEGPTLAEGVTVEFTDVELGPK